MGKPYRLLDADATAAERRMIMPKNVVCKKCNNLVNDWCEKVIDSPDPDMQRDCQHFREKTNADIIRSMDDEELNDLFHEIYNAGVDDASSYEWGHRTNSFEWTMEWLKQPCGGGE